MEILDLFEKYCETECPKEETSITGRKQCRHKCHLLDFVDFVNEQEEKRIKAIVRKSVEKTIQPNKPCGTGTTNTTTCTLTIDQNGITMRKLP